MHTAYRLFARNVFGSAQNNVTGSFIHQWQKPSTIYLRRIKWVTGRAQLENHFRKFGEIKDISMFFDPATGLHRGFASITFATADSAKNAIQQGPHYIDDGLINVDFELPMDNMKHHKFSTGQPEQQQKASSRSRSGANTMPVTSQGPRS